MFKLRFGRVSSVYFQSLLMEHEGTSTTVSESDLLTNIQSHDQEESILNSTISPNSGIHTLKITINNQSLKITNHSYT